MRFPPFLLMPALLAFSLAHAQEQSNSPYIDSIKKGLKEKPASGDSGETYLEREQRKLKEREAKPESEESYIDQLKKRDPKLNAPRKQDSYSEDQKARLSPGRGSAIDALKEGRSELHARREGDIHHAFGFRMGAAMSRTMTNSEGVSYTTLYGSGFAPDFTLFYEFQPFHSEIFGNIGLVASGGVAYFRGTGQFSRELAKPAAMGGGTFGTTSKTDFSLLTLPASAGANYRFNLARWIRPYVQVSPTLMGYLESRSDTKPGNHGYSTAIAFSGGANILLDFFDKGTAWDLYADGGIKHYYLTIDYTRLSTLTGDIKFSISGLSLGMTFEL